MQGDMMGAPTSTQIPHPEFVARGASVDSSPHLGEDRGLVRPGEQPHPEHAAAGASVDPSPQLGDDPGLERPGVKNPAHAEPSDHGDTDARASRILETHIDETQVGLDGASARSGWGCSPGLTRPRSSPNHGEESTGTG